MHKFSHYVELITILQNTLQTFAVCDIIYTVSISQTFAKFRFGRIEMKITRIITLLLLLSFALTACGNNQTKTDTTQYNSDSSPISDEDNLYVADLPEITFDNADFNVVGIMETGLDSTFKFDAEEASGDVLENALFKRNRAIEDRFMVNFNYEILDQHNKTYTELNQNVMSDDTVYDMYMLICRNAFKAAQEGLIYPIDDIPYIDLTAPWYIQSINEQLTIDGKLFFAYSAECLNVYSQSTVVFYNKQLADEFQLGSLYGTVRDGEWTIDKMLEYARLVKSSENLGNDTVYGISTEHDMLYPALWVGSDTRIIEKDEDDIPAYTLTSNEKMLSLLELAVNIKNESNLVVNSLRDLEPKERIQGDVLFSENKALFRVAGLCHVSNLRNMKADYGIIPLPKYDTAQEDYVGRMCDGWLYVVPKNSDKLEMTGVLMEALAAESMNTTIPAYFDVVLDSKVTRDDEAAEMLDIIFNNISVDLGDTVWMFAARDKLTTVIVNGSNQFASTAESIKANVENEITKAVAALNEIE